MDVSFFQQVSFGGTELAEAWRMKTGFGWKQGILFVHLFQLESRTVAILRALPSCTFFSVDGQKTRCIFVP